MKKTILILGGAGYIGSHVAFLLNKKGYNVVIIDKLIHKQTFNHKWAKLIKGDFNDKEILKNIFTNYNVEAVMHFAAFIEVGISMQHPAEFYENNVTKTIDFLNFMLKFGVNKFIFSSSCAIYGNPEYVPIDERHPFNPISPYGKNKLAIEFVLQDYSKAYNLNYISLRYFNAAGADYLNGLGEQHNPETHVIPLMLQAVQNDAEFNVFGSNYNTDDGTCIRDYIHVKDLAQAHLLALNYLNSSRNSDYFNLGSGKGYSVKEIIKGIESITKKNMKINYCPSRPGDVATLIADNNKIKKILGWQAEYSSLKNILESAYFWQNSPFIKNRFIINNKKGFSRYNSLG